MELTTDRDTEELLHPTLPGSRGFSEADSFIFSFTMNVPTSSPAAVAQANALFSALLSQAWLDHTTRRVVTRA